MQQIVIGPVGARVIGEVEALAAASAIRPRVSNGRRRSAGRIWSRICSRIRGDFARGVCLGAAYPSGTRNFPRATTRTAPWLRGTTRLPPATISATLCTTYNSPAMDMAHRAIWQCDIAIVNIIIAVHRHVPVGYRPGITPTPIISMRFDTVVFGAPAKSHGAADLHARSVAFGCGWHSITVPLLTLVTTRVVRACWTVQQIGALRGG